MKYTFLLPAYKAKFFKEALESIKKQTYKDFEVLISNDCSPEPLKDIYDEVCGNDTRFLYRCNEQNMGRKSLVAHWNLLVDMCNTDYLIMASDDDMYDTHFLEEIDKLTTKYPKSDLIRSRVREIDVEGNIVRKDAIYEEYVSHLEFIQQYEYLNHIECVANHVFRTKALKDMGGFVDFPLAWSSDTATTFTIAQNGVVNTKDILFCFRISGMNISTDETKNIMRKKFEAILMYDRYITELLNSIKRNSSYENILYDTVTDYHKKHVAVAAGYYSRSLSFRDFLKFINDFNQKGLFKSKFQIYVLIKKWLRTCYKK